MELLGFVGAVTGPLGLVLGIVNHFRDWHRQKQEVVDKRSQFHMEGSLKGYEEARKLLQDGNNDRATWIQAARALKHAQALSAHVTVDQHLRLLELYKLDYRGFFYRALSKPAAFFYGGDGSLPIKEAAEFSTAGEERQGRSVVSTLKELSEKSIYAVWEAAQWPESYADPLDKEFPGPETGNVLVLFPGLQEFIEHKAQYDSAAGKLFKRRP